MQRFAYAVCSLALWGNLLGGSVALITLLCFFSQSFWILGLLEHFRSQYCVLLLIAVFLGLFSRHPWPTKIWSLLWLIPFLINMGFLAPLYHHRVLTTADAPPPLQVLYATLDHETPEVSQAIGSIQRQAPDILALLEVTPQSLPRLAAALTDYQLLVAEPRTNSHGSAWFVTKHPAQPIQFQGAELMHLPTTSDRPLLKATIAYAGRPIELLCFHVIRPQSQHRSDFQKVEMRALAEWSRDWIQKQQRDLVVVGDFNSTPWSAPFRQLLATSGLVNSQAGFGLQPTWNAWFPAVLRIPIDHCLHSPGLFTVSRRIGPRIGSDHLPLLVTLQLTHSRPETGGF